MKKWLLILSVFMVAGFSAVAQEEDNQPDREIGGKLMQRMQEYIQSRLRLSKKETEKFSPVFIRYYRDFARTHHENRADRLKLQKEIIDLRIRYRDEFRQVIEEQKANRVFQVEDEFRKKAVEMIRENRRDRLEKAPTRTNKAVL